MKEVAKKSWIFLLHLTAFVMLGKERVSVLVTLAY